MEKQDKKALGFIYYNSIGENQEHLFWDIKVGNHQYPQETETPTSFSYGWKTPQTVKLFIKDLRRACRKQPRENT